jgi:ABC-2 type transport system permease protein
MRKLLAIIRKDTLTRFSSPSELLFFIALPIVFTFLLAGGTPSGEDDPRIGLVVVDEANSPLSAEIVAALEDSSAVRPELVSRAEAQEDFDARRASVVLIIPAGLTLESLEAGPADVELLQQPNDLDATVARRAVLTALRGVSSAISAAQIAAREAERIQPFGSEAERTAYFDDSLAVARNIQADAPQRGVVVRGATPDPSDYAPAANSSAGQLITWVFIPF